MKIQAIALNTFREAVRNKILYSVLLFAILLVCASALFGSVTIGDQIKVIKDFGLFSLSFFGAIITVVSGVSLLNKELKQKTIYNILSKPVHRWQFIVGKHFGLTITVGLLVSLMGLALIAIVGLYEGQLDLLLFQGLLFSLLEVMVVAAIVIFFSSIVVTTTLTGLFTLGTYLAGRSINYLTFFLSDEDPSQAGVRGLITLADWILPDLSLFNFNDAIVYGNSVSISNLAYAVCYGICYSTVLLILAALIFSRRELT